jgi:hypothetical protein
MGRKYFNPKLDAEDIAILKNRIEIVRQGKQKADGPPVAGKTHTEAVRAVAEENHMNLAYLRKSLGLPPSNGSDDGPDDDEGEDEDTVAVAPLRRPWLIG